MTPAAGSRERRRTAVAAFALPAALALGMVLPAQQLRWQVPTSGPSTVEYYWMGAFADYDHDGYRDFLRVVLLSPTNWYITLQIASGLDGSTLWETNSTQLNYPVACYAGDMDGDGEPDIATLNRYLPQRRIEVMSPRTGKVHWEVFGSQSGEFGSALLGDLDVTGDGKPDFVTITSHTSESDVYVYGNRGSLLYTIPCLSQGLIAISLCKMGDMDGDGCDDFVVGCNDTTGRGLQRLVSGQTGATIRESLGLLPGDLTSEFVSNLGDIDGDGVNDYAAFAYWSAAREIAVAYSGQTGNVIRSWVDYANSVVTGEDFDQDGVNDIVTGADWIISLNVRGWTWCHSGRDGAELWRVANFQAPPGSGGYNGTSGWMEYSASLGMQPGSPYPVVVWMDIEVFSAGTYPGRTRAYDTMRAGQGPVTGTACSSTGTLPLIGARSLPAGSRITIAKSLPGALAGLWAAFQPLPQPIDMTLLGFTGCTLYVTPDASWFRMLGTAGLDRGYAAVDLPHVLSPTALGIAVHAQWIVLDPLTGDFAATRMHQLQLQ